MTVTDTTRGIQKYFAIAYTVHYTCASHHGTKILPDIAAQKGINHGDMFLAQRHIQPGSYCPSLTDYLMHAIPRHSSGTSRAHSWSPLHRTAPIPCSHHACGAEAAVTSISTDWPLILRLDPLLRARNIAFDPDAQDLACPLTMVLDDVEYMLIARVIYLAPKAAGTIGHYLTKIRLKNSTYMYDDCRRGGVVTELGPVHLLEDHEANTSFVLYLRTSKSSVGGSKILWRSRLIVPQRTTRTVEEIESDYATIPVPPKEVIDIPDDADAEVDQMLIDTITSSPLNSSPGSDNFYTPEQTPVPSPRNAAADISFPETDSNTPCPVFCICGVNEPEGDDDPDEVQCERCRYWSHFRCYPGVDWHDPDNRFLCRGCRVEEEATFCEVGAIVMLPDLSGQNKDWSSPDVLWYPAQFIQHHRRRPNQFNEYEFRWLACNDGTLYISGDSMLPVLMLQTNFRSRKFLQEIREVQLAEEQIGQIRLPFYMKPDYPGHKNPVLSSIFDAALPTVAKILADWRNGNRVVEAFNDCISGSRGIDMHRKPTLFLEAFGLIPTPELEAVLFEPLSRLMKPHPELENLAEDECNRRVMGVGSALFQLLAIQHELGEPLNLNGDLISDLWEESVVPDRMDGTAALTAMFGSTALKANIPVDQQMLRFNRDHTIYDRDFRPPSFRRMLPSIRPPRAPIAVVLPGELKRAGSPLSEDEKPPKRQRKEKTHNDMEAEGVKKKQAKKKAPGGKRRAKTPPVNAGRKLRSRNVV
ncbi:hypothetical protein DFH06DRAFT_1151258 [Mycena polygramma]|nr:hypothetical protein DFH06DRAFT_1151258 [Mycena polygramma]